MKLKIKLAITVSSLALALGAASIAIVHSSKKAFQPAFATYNNGDAATYYNSIDSTQSGNTLLSALRNLNLSKRQSTVGYSSMGTSPSGQFKYTDYDTSTVQYDSNGQPYGTKISSFYTFTSATSWNREHVWPNSHGGGSGGDAGAPYPDADIHMPRPTISSENSSRGNSFFVEGMNHSSNGWDPYTAGYSAESRGEAARITFYCTLVNSKLILAPSNTTPSGTDSVTGQSFGSGHTMGNLETLIKWNINYPVSQREKNRNEGAEYLQGNRNAFVDHPEYACKIWGNVNSTIKNMCANASWDVGPSVSISKSAASLTVDETTTISATSSDSSNITWTSSDSTVVTVSSGSSSSGTNVTLTGIGPGTATITAKATINSTVYSATCSVTVSTSGGGSGGDEGNTDGYSILISDLDTAYPTTAKSYTAASGIAFTAYNTANFSSKVQFKKSGGYLYNNSSLNLGTLTLNGLNGTVTVYAGSTQNPSSTTISGSNGVYNLSGYNYFKIINNSGSVATCSSINVDIQDTSKTLSSIAVSGQKTTYAVGDTFVKPTVTATYSNSTTADVSSSATFSGYNMNTAGNQTVTVSYTENGTTKTTSYSITVSAVTLSSIAVSNQKTSFTVGDSFSFGGTVTATYSNSTTADVTSSATFSGYNMSTAGNQTVTVSVTQGGVTKTTTYNITVSSSGGSSQTETGTQRISASSSSSYYHTGDICPSGGTDSASATCDAFDVSWLKNGGNSIVYTYAEMRIYGSHSFTIVPKEGYTITTISITANSSSYANAVGGTSVTNCTKTVSGSSVTLTPTDGTSAVGFTNSAQSRLNYIVVSYEHEVAGGTNPVTSISATVSKTFHPGEKITTSDITVKDNNNKTVTDFTFANNNYSFTYSDAASGGAATNKTFTNAISYESLTCSLTVQVQRVAYVAPAASSLTHTGSEFSSAGIGSSYKEGQTATVDGITFTVDGYIYSSKLSLSSSKTSAPGKVVNTTPYTSGITNVTVSGATPNIQLSTNGSTWVDLSSATPSTVNYFYLKIFYKTTTQSNYVNITQIDVDIKGYESATNLANYVMYEDTNNQCTTKFSVAQGYFENMTTAERTTFMTSEDYVISNARTRLLAWAANQGKTISVSGGDYIISNAKKNILTVAINNQGVITIVIAISLVSISVVAVYFFLRKKREK